MPSLPAALRVALVANTLYRGLAAAQTPDPITIPFVNNASSGPDGPWWPILLAIDFPDQYVSMLPSLSQTSLTINGSSACNNQNAACPLPVPTLWQESGAYRVSNGETTQSAPFDASAWDADYAELLRLQGQAAYAVERITLHDQGVETSSSFLDDHGMAISQDMSATYPGGAKYTMDVGYLSLYAGQQTFNWTSVNGTFEDWNRTLPVAYARNYIPSLSYGLHIGSVYPNVTGSLVLGGYDTSRVLTSPIVSDTDSLTLTDISLNVSSGGYAWQNASSSGPIKNLLRANGSTLDRLDVHPRPGVPYMYLPRQTCDAIAAQLPVTWDADFKLYFWNTKSQWYRDIITSPHYLSFSFAGSDVPINVPFALLNLTLTSPLVSEETQYFPCSPFDSSSSTGATLGNAFLQAAFLGQNWETNKLFLAQAPGPDFLPVNRQTIGSTDESIAPATNPPDWESTWSRTLKPLDSNVQGPLSGSGNGGNGGQGASKPKSTGLSGGAIAGIVIGAVAAIAVAAGLIFFFFVLRRRRRQSTAHQPVAQRDPSETPMTAASSPPQYYSPDPGSTVHSVAAYKAPLALHEVDATPAVQEVSAEREVGELPAEVPERTGEANGDGEKHR